MRTGRVNRVGAVTGRSLMICLLIFMVMLITGETYAKDLFVSPGGSDSVSYTDNTINKPWATPQKAWYNARAGDTVYFRAGTYTISSQINTAGNGYDGTSANPITFRNYETEIVTLSSSLITVFNIERNYNYVSGLNFQGGGVFFYVGYNTTATNFKISNCTARMSEGGDNVAFVKLTPRAGNAVIEYCTIVGPGLDVNQNTACLILFRTPGIKIRNCDLSNAPFGIYYKHANDQSDSGIEIAYNYVHDTGRHSIFTNTNYAYIHDNLIGRNSAQFRVNEENGVAGGDYNRIWYNTLFDIDLNLSNDGAGAVNNDVRGNVFAKTSMIHRYSSIPHNTVMDYNLHPGGTAFIENRVNYTLDAWRSYTGGSSNSRLFITPSNDFVGGSSPSTIEDFALSNSSAGFQVITRDVDGDGNSETTDMGAYIAMVGPQGRGAVSPGPGPVPPPSSDVPSPRVDSVEIGPEEAGDDTIFMDDFENTTLATAYSDYNIGSNNALTISGTVGFGGSSKSLVTNWQSTGQVGAGSVAYFFGRNPAGSKSRSSEDFNEIYWRFYMKLSDGWQGNPQKLTRASVFSSSDWKQAMIAHLWQGKGLALGTDPKTFISGSTNTSTTYNDQANGTWLGAISGNIQVYATENANHWICIESRVKLNTPGQSDGEQDLWIDGELDIHHTGINWIGSWSEYGINMILFGNYWNGGTPRPQQRYIDNLVISASRIGLAGSPVNPAIYKTAFDYSGHTQGSFQGQVSTTASESGIAWTGEVAGTGNTLVVNSTTGAFKGDLAGRTSLGQCATYYVRVNQADEGGNYSQWSPWKKFVTIKSPWTGGSIGAPRIQ